MRLNPLAVKEEIPTLGSDISNATVFSVLNNSGAPCQIRIDNGDATDPEIALATGERVVIVKKPDSVVYAEDLTGTTVTDVSATKVAYEG